MADSDLEDPTRVPGHLFAVEMREAWARILRETPEERAAYAARYEAQLERDRAEMAAEAEAAPGLLIADDTRSA